MFKFFAIVSCMVLSMSVVASAQLEWDKKKPLKPVENPSPVGASRVDIISEAKALLAKNEIPVLSETADEEGGKHTIVTEQVVFARGIVAKTQLGHFAEIGASSVQDISRARVQIRIEIAPSTPTNSLVGVSAKFEGLRQGMGQQWIETPSLGLLEDKILKSLITNLTGRTFEDVKPDDGILTVN
ncbi:MAG: hypothetical protein IPF53_03575 [Blastocatellia bacterium]|nr:hypothetical protein [Blastocatellia bacterium]MBK6428393.1 hypothetical protein [Blastocatellia bacterium]